MNNALFVLQAMIAGVEDWERDFVLWCTLKSLYSGKSLFNAIGAGVSCHLPFSHYLNCSQNMYNSKSVRYKETVDKLHFPSKTFDHITK